MANFFKLVVDMALNATGYEVGMKRVESATGRFAEKLGDELKEKMAEVFGTAALVEWGKRTIENAEHLLDLSEAIDVSTDKLQEWGYAAKRSGSNLDAV